MRLKALRKRTIIACSAGALLLLLLIRFAIFLLTPAGGGKPAQLFDFEGGYSLRRIATELEQARVISSARFFILYTELRGKSGKLKAGTYLFDDTMLPSRILRRLTSGDVHVRRFAVPEGYSVYQIAELLQQRGIFRKDAFLRKCFDRPLLKDLGISGRSVEGYLLPSTYDITPKMDEEALIREMVRQFGKACGERFGERAGALRTGRAQVLTLASMIEKEAVAPAERPLISSVFHNRLKRGMPLQSDPTAVYGIRAFAGRVSKEDILGSSPYNTYRIKGLPPGPIGNPSLDAIEAALSPSRTPYLYFVAKGDGTHHFSATLEEHNRAVRLYLRSGAPSAGGKAPPATGYQNDRPYLAGRR